jgi:hypothetical protein
MSPHAGIVLAFMALLAGAGVLKIVRPAPTAGALSAAGLPSSALAVRGLGVLEVAIGVRGIVFGSPADAVAGSVIYGAFALFVIYAMTRRVPISSCGCLGSADTPPSLIHVAVDLTAVGVLVVGAVSPIGPWGGLDSVSIGEAVPMTLFIGTTLYLIYALIAVLPQPVTPVPGVAIHISETPAADG